MLVQCRSPPAMLHMPCPLMTASALLQACPGYIGRTKGSKAFAKPSYYKRVATGILLAVPHL